MTHLYRCSDCGYWTKEPEPLELEDEFCCPNEVLSTGLGDLIHYGRQIYTGCGGVLEAYEGTREELRKHEPTFFA